MTISLRKDPRGRVQELENRQEWSRRSVGWGKWGKRKGGEREGSRKEEGQRETTERARKGWNEHPLTNEKKAF